MKKWNNRKRIKVKNKKNKLVRAKYKRKIINLKIMTIVNIKSNNKYNKRRVTNKNKNNRKK